MSQQKDVDSPELPPADRWGAKGTRPSTYYVVASWNGSRRLCINCNSVAKGVGVLKKRPSWLYMVHIGMELFRRDNIRRTNDPDPKADKWAWDEVSILRKQHLPDWERLERETRKGKDNADARTETKP